MHGQYSIYRDVEVSEILPTFGPSDGGTTVEIDGTNFFASSTGKCRFGNISVPFVYKSSTLIHCVTPPYPHGSLTNVRISMNGVDYSLRSVHFKYTARPNISHIHPQSGPIRGGTRITLYGNHFSSTYSLSCRFNEVIVTAVFFSKNILVCISPKMIASASQTIVSDNGKDVSNSIKFSFIVSPRLELCPLSVPLSQYYG